MQIDSADLWRHYKSLSDKELLLLHRTDLTAAAQKVYDQEMERRSLVTGPESEDAAEREDPELQFDPGQGDEWEGESAVATAFSVQQREWRWTDPPAEAAARACEALRESGILCRLNRPERQLDQPALVEVLVPVGQFLNATAVLEWEIFNPRFEEEWRTHFESLTDEELETIDLDLMRSGIRDRAERLERAFRSEVARRKA